jgi:DNA-binding NarL/FixJ family response regulator
MKCILIADGSAVIRHSLRHLFQQNGWEVCAEAADGREAIAKAQTVRPNVIVLDVSMPVMNGIAAAHSLKKIVPEAHLILFTFLGDFLSPTAMQSAGISAVVSKSEAGKLVMTAQSLVEAA